MNVGDMWGFIIFFICAFFLFFFAIMADKKRKENEQKKQSNDSNNPLLLSNQIDERLGIKKRGGFDSKTDRKRKENVYRDKLRPVSGQSMPRINNAQTKSILQIEFPRRKQILEESIRFIQETDNIEILLSRYNIALEHYYWIVEQKAKGLSIYFDTEEEGFENALNRIRNYHTVRIAMEKFINYKKKMYGLKTAKAKQNNTVQMFEFLEKCKQSLKDHLNKNESESKLNKLYNNTEDFYSTNAN